MRIIGGNLRGTKLYSLEGDNTRPTLDRVKESLFNMIQFDIQDVTFLDLFAGSGQIGLEALSRGAKRVLFCDNSIEAISIINKNIEKTHMKETTEVYNKSFDDLLKTLNKNQKEKIDIIYIDPPYKTDFAYISTKLILEQKLIDENSIVIVETDREDIIDKIEKLEQQENIEIYNKRKYGRAYLIFLRYRRKG